MSYSALVLRNPMSDRGSVGCRGAALYCALILARVRSLGEMSGDVLGFLLSACADANAAHFLPHVIFLLI